MVFKLLFATFILAVFFTVNYSDALKCVPCNKRICKKPVFCKGGLTKDVCNCCDVCAKVKGEVCGGPSNIRGKCDKNLRCDKPPKDFNAIGRCVCKGYAHCRIHCKYGFLPNPKGCLLCKCRTKPKKLRQICSTSYLSPKGICAKGLRCIGGRCLCKGYAHCRIHCKYGFLPNPKGCLLCKCRTKPKKLRQICSTSYLSPKGICAKGLRCIGGRCLCKGYAHCRIHCKYGFLPNPKGCLLCKCRTKPKKLRQICSTSYLSPKGICAKGLRCIGGRCRIFYRP